MRQNFRYILFVFPLMLLAVPELLLTTASAETSPRSIDPERNTVSTPLLMGMRIHEAFKAELSLIESGVDFDTLGDMGSQILDSKAVRIRYEQGMEPAAFLWRLQSPLSLRNRWIRIRVSGDGIPDHAKVAFSKSQITEKNGFMVLFNISAGGGESFFKVPDQESFAKVENLGFVFMPRDGGADFSILSVDILAAGQIPLSRHRQDSNRFEFDASSTVPLFSETAAR